MKTCFDFKVKRLPLSISDNDPYQQFCLFSPNFDKHFDIEIDQLGRGTFVVRDAKKGLVDYKFPTTLLSFDQRNKDQIMMQTRFMAWHSQNQVAIIDINAEPPIEGIFEIPTEIATDEQRISQVTTAAVPFLDLSQYQESHERNPENRPYGISNYFKSHLNYAKTDQLSRLKRK